MTEEKPVKNPDFDNVLVTEDQKLQFLPWRAKIIEEIGEPLIASISIKGNEKDTILQFANDLASSGEVILSMFCLQYSPKTIFFEVTDKEQFEQISPIKKVDWIDKKSFMRQFCNASHYFLIKPKDRTFARLTLPPYTDDFCEVIQLSDDFKQAIIRIMPRLNIPELELKDDTPQPFNIKLFRRKKIQYEDKEVKMSFDGQQVADGYSYNDMHFIGNSHIIKVPVTNLQFYVSYTKEEMENFKIPIRTHKAREEAMALIRAKQEQEQMLKKKRQTPTPKESKSKQENGEEESNSESGSSSGSTASTSSDSSEESSSEESESSSESQESSSMLSNPEDEKETKEPERKKPARKIMNKKPPPQSQKPKQETRKPPPKKKVQESYSESSDFEDEFKGKIKKRPLIKPGSIEAQKIMQKKLSDVSHFKITGASSDLLLKCSLNDTELAIPILMRTSGFGAGIKPKLFSLVELPTSEVAVVVKLDDSNAHCLIFLNRIIPVPLTTELPILQDDNTVHDRHGRRVFPGDVILIKIGPRAGFHGTVIHTRCNRVFGNFVKDDENQPIFACGREIELIEDDLGPINL